MHDEFNKILLQEPRARKRLIIVADEAQNLDSSVVETIRLDLKLPGRSCYRLFAGQAELADKLASRKLSQLRQRLCSLSCLTPLS